MNVPFSSHGSQAKQHKSVNKAQTHKKVLWARLSSQITQIYNYRLSKGTTTNTDLPRFSEGMQVRAQMKMSGQGELSRKCILRHRVVILKRGTALRRRRKFF